VTSGEQEDADPLIQQGLPAKCLSRTSHGISNQKDLYNIARQSQSRKQSGRSDSCEQEDADLLIRRGLSAKLR